MLLAQTCKPLVAKYNSLLLKTGGMERRFYALIGALQTAVSALTAAPVQDIYDAINRVSGVETVLDDTILDDTRTLLSSKCFANMIPPSILGSIGSYASTTEFPVVFSKRLLSSIQTSLTAVVRDAISTGLQTGVVVSLISTYDTAISKSGLSDILDEMDYVHDCLSSICGQTVVDHASTVRSEFNLGHDNKFNTSVLSQWNTNVTVVEQITLLKQNFDLKQTSIDNLSFGG